MTLPTDYYYASYSFPYQYWDWCKPIPKNALANVLGLKTNGTELSLNKTTRLAVKRSHVGLWYG